MITCTEFKNGDLPVKLEQRNSGSFRVTYGKHCRDYLNYAEASKEFGECAFHSLSCAGMFNGNEE